MAQSLFRMVVFFSTLRFITLAVQYTTIQYEKTTDIASVYSSIDIV